MAGVKDPTKTSPSPAGRAPSSETHRLVVLQSPDPNALNRPIILLIQARVELGRSGHVSGPLGLDDLEVSRAHGHIDRDAESGEWVLHDSGSRNGTFVDGARVQSTALRHGAVIRVGSTLLLFESVRFKADEVLVRETPPLLGPSIAMQRVRANVAQVAGHNLSVLIQGETGVGKELVARAVHHQSGRQGPFVAVNCAALPEQLAESELFGHLAGSFTGAGQSKQGLFATAEGGTLFLDEIGELPRSLQPKLLRALATGEVRPVGDTKTRSLDVRVVAATNRDLVHAVREGDFRKDLYARIATWTIEVPPLRERRDDILPLAGHFLAPTGGPTSVGANAAEALVLYGWPYNVRELEQQMKVAALRATTQRAIEIEHLPEEMLGPLGARLPQVPSAGPPPLSIQVKPTGVPTADELRKVLDHFGGNVAQVARFFGKDRRQIYRWAERFEIDSSAFRDQEVTDAGPQD